MVSIVIPIYNSGDSLDKCLSSIHEQLFSDWECILINDGSTDDSLEICQKWSRIDNRYKVFNQNNQGVSAARNAGIIHSIGNWITFIDSDDWIEIDYLSSLTEAIDESCQLFVSGQIRDYSDGRTISYIPQKKGIISISNNNAHYFNNLNESFLLYAPHEKIFNKDIIVRNNIWFDRDCSYGEDLQFVYEYLEYCSYIYLIDNALYHYNIADSGTLSTLVRNNQFEQDYKQWQIVYNYYKNHDLLIEESEKYLAKRLWGIVYDGLFCKNRIKDSDYFEIILSIPEMWLLRLYSSCFFAAGWIKFSIKYRLVFVFKFLHKIGRVL